MYMYYYITHLLFSLSSLSITNPQPIETILNPQTGNTFSTNYVHYFETHRYRFHFDSDNPNNKIIISNADLNINIHLSNTSSYILTIDNNLSLNYDYDSNWNEIQTIIHTSDTTPNYPMLTDNTTDTANRRQLISYNPKGTECDESFRGYKGVGYRGCQTKTVRGLTCQQWTSQSPHKHGNTPQRKRGKGLGRHNYCRNPDGEKTIWCYTTSKRKRWDYCKPISNGWCDERRRGTKNNGYRGCQTKTKGGYTCQKWTKQSPQRHGNTPARRKNKGLGDHNFCRNPDGERDIWCYTTSRRKRWDYCAAKKHRNRRKRPKKRKRRKRRRRRRRKSRNYKWKGCYKDTARRALRYGPHRWKFSINKCYRTCKTEGYKYFALQAGSWCSCENSWSRIKKYGRGTGCPASRKGAGWRNDVFRIKNARRKGRKYGHIVKEASGKTAKLRCRRGYKIRVLVASYGSNCKARNRNNQRSRLRKACNGKRTCSYKIDHKKIGDPARGCAKDYTYQYQCKGSRRRRKRRRVRRRRSRRRSRGGRRGRNRWACTYVRYSDYQRKLCLRKRGRRGGVLRRRRRSNGGRAFQQGYQAGLKSVGGSGAAMAMSRMPFRRRPMPAKRMFRGVNVPPRIQLLDLKPGQSVWSGPGGPGSGKSGIDGGKVASVRLKTGQLGTGFGIGMSGKGHHKKYGMSTYAIRAAMMMGAKKKDLKRAARVVDKEMQGQGKGEMGPGEERHTEKDYEFKGFDGFGDGRMTDEEEEGSDGQSNKKDKKRGRKRRDLLVDYMDNERKCVGYMGVYEICVGYELIEIKQFIGREWNGFIGGESENESNYLDLYVFIYDLVGETEQCFVDLDMFDVCMSAEGETDMIVVVSGAFEDKEYRFDFADDNDWNEVNVIETVNEKEIEKCVRLFEVKMCMVYEGDFKFKMMLYTVV